MQSELLPELPSDTSQALNNLVRNLNEFNETFANNTVRLRNALDSVNESYRIQADIIQAVHDMDVMRMARANVQVLRQLEQCTDRLEVFNQYLIDIEGYTEAIHRFETLFNEQANRLHVLEEIRDFFNRHKAEIAHTTADADRTLQESLTSIRESTAENVNELHARFVEQGEQFRSILEQEKESFEQINNQIKAQFNEQLEGMPALARQLEKISAIPELLDHLIEKIEKSNARLASEVKQTLKSAHAPAPFSEGQGEITYRAPATTPMWIKLTGWCAIVIIALACIFNVVVYFFPKEQPDEETTIEQISAQQDSLNTEQSSAPQEEKVPILNTNTKPKTVQ